jgi:hypothetical protein
MLKPAQLLDQRANQKERSIWIWNLIGEWETMFSPNGGGVPPTAFDDGLSERPQSADKPAIKLQLATKEKVSNQG